MPLDLGPSINASYLPALDQYSQTAQEGYGQDMGNVQRDAMRELDAEIGGQDLQGRQAGFLRKATGQQFSEDANRFQTDLGMKRAELGETMRQRGQARSWEVQDRDERLARLRKQAEMQREEANKTMTGNLLGTVLGGVGRIGGAMAGGPVGSAIGGAAADSISAMF